jgi:UDP-N-acetylglucosamine 2-epimerase (non-hydrolysing)
MGKFAGCKVGHLESGLRSFNIFEPFPEEISRIITFLLSDIYFCPGQWAVDNLKHFHGIKVNIEMNPMYDGVMYALKHGNKISFGFQRFKYVIVSIHRYENIFTSRLTEQIVPILKDASKKWKMVVALHPSTRKRLQSLGIFERLKNNKKFVLHERFNFIDWINVCSRAEFVITDGGSNQEELSYLGIPTILFRKATERQEGLNGNIVLSEMKKEVILKFFREHKKYRRPFMKTSCCPSQIVINFISQRENVFPASRTLHKH